MINSALKNLTPLLTLSDSVRLKLLLQICTEAQVFDLREKPPQSRNNGTDLAKLLKLSKSTITHHLKKLLQAELISVRRVGLHKYYFPNAQQLQTIAEILTHQVSVKSKFTKFLIMRNVKYLNRRDFLSAIDYIGLYGYKFARVSKLKNKELRFYLYEDQTLLRLLVTPFEHKIILEIHGIIDSSLRKRIEELRNLLAKFLTNIQNQKALMLKMKT